MKRRQNNKISANWWIRPSPIMPRKQRMMAYLADAAATHKAKLERPNYYAPGLRLHCEGGYGYNKDLRFLTIHGYLKMVRVPYSKGWGGDYDLRRTYLVITDKGLMAVDSGKI